MQSRIFTTLGAHMFQISEIDQLYYAVNMLSVGKMREVTGSMPVFSTMCYGA